MRALDSLLRTNIAPLLKDRGWKRGGRYLRKVSAEGDVAIIHIHALALGLADLELLVDGGVATQVNLRRIGLHGTPPDQLVEPAALWQERLTGPARPDAPHDATWLANLDGDPRLPAFLDALVDFADHLSELLDRERLLEAVQDPATPMQNLQARPREVAVAMLLAYRGPSPGLDQLMERLKTLEWGPGAIVAIRAQLAEQRGDSRR